MTDQWRSIEDQLAWSRTASGNVIAEPGTIASALRAAYEQGVEDSAGVCDARGWPGMGDIIRALKEAKENIALLSRVKTLKEALQKIAAYPAERFDVIASDMRHIARTALSGKE